MRMDTLDSQAAGAAQEEEIQRKLEELVTLAKDQGFITYEEINEILRINKSDMQIILTGLRLPEEMREYVDAVTTVNTEYLSEICVDKESE